MAAFVADAAVAAAHVGTTVRACGHVVASGANGNVSRDNKNAASARGKRIKRGANESAHDTKASVYTSCVDRTRSRFSTARSPAIKKRDFGTSPNPLDSTFAQSQTFVEETDPPFTWTQSTELTQVRSNSESSVPPVPPVPQSSESSVPPVLHSEFVFPTRSPTLVQPSESSVPPVSQSSSSQVTTVWGGDSVATSFEVPPPATSTPAPTTFESVSSTATLTSSSPAPASSSLIGSVASLRPTPTPGKFSGPVVAGITIGALAGWALLCLAVFLLYKWHRKRASLPPPGVLPGPRRPIHSSPYGSHPNASSASGVYGSHMRNPIYVGGVGIEIEKDSSAEEESPRPPSYRAYSTPCPKSRYTWLPSTVSPSTVTANGSPLPRKQQTSQDVEMRKLDAGRQKAYNIPSPPLLPAPTSPLPAPPSSAVYSKPPAPPTTPATNNGSGKDNASSPF
ncbi:hypothetical protein BU26DRAFT_602692, partial [Trematosphaeria pertusa]